MDFQANNRTSEIIKWLNKLKIDYSCVDFEENEDIIDALHYLKKIYSLILNETKTNEKMKEIKEFDTRIEYKDVIDLNNEIESLLSDLENRNATIAKYHNLPLVRYQSKESRAGELEALLRERKTRVNLDR
ncbi:hypothetical protein MXB_5042 [Myxobolus squamalis]|nr:hypothetical protein MXB_5042 [Myxobolus squamalis]